jgi:hypothetical protein
MTFTLYAHRINIVAKAADDLFLLYNTQLSATLGLIFSGLCISVRGA